MARSIDRPWVALLATLVLTVGMTLTATTAASAQEDENGPDPEQLLEGDDDGPDLGQLLDGLVGGDEERRDTRDAPHYETPGDHPDPAHTQPEPVGALDRNGTVRAPTEVRTGGGGSASADRSAGAATGAAFFVVGLAGIIGLAAARRVSPLS